MDVLKLFLLCLCYISNVSGVFFIMGEKEKRCFYDDYGYGSLTTFRYNSTTARDKAAIGLVVQVYDPDHKVVLQREYGSGSTVTFTAEAAGEYGICLSTNSTKWAMYAKDTIKISFTLDNSDPENRHTTDDEENEDGEENKGPLSDEDTRLVSLQRRVKTVMETVEYITRAQNSNRRVEKYFRERAETINSRVLVWAVVQVGVLLLTGWWQMRSLKNFFIAKKLV